MTPEQRAALDALLPQEQRTGDERADLIAAARVSKERRRSNSRHGGAVIAALHAEGLSWREIEDVTGLSYGTARRWAEAAPTE